MPRLTVWQPGKPPLTHDVTGEACSIGRSRENDLVLSDDALSRRHAELRRDGERWVIADLGSRNGTQVNGAEVTKPTPVGPGDQVVAGDTVIDVHPDEVWPRGDGREDAATRAARKSGPSPVVGRSAALRALLDDATQAAATDESVLITGETGSGKDVLARFIHERSPRRDGPFVVINCPALPGSLFESELFGVEAGVATGVVARPGRLEGADGGTLFLDEAGDLEATAQAKLLRFLEDRSFERVGGRKSLRLDVRVIAATNQDLDGAISNGRFRRDLYYRLAGVPLAVPPLRERREDVPALVEHFLARPGAPATSITTDAMDLLTRHSWPGNIRELQHVVARARLAARGGPIDAEHLPAELRRADGTTAPGHGARLARVTAAMLRDRIVRGGESFWTVVQEPYLRREISRDDVRALIAEAHAECGESYKRVAELFGIGAQHKKLLNFLRNHDLGTARRKGGSDAAD